MNLTAGFDYFNWIILPLLIFLSRLSDVTLATLRHIFVSKGYKKIVPLLGFIEVMIWLIAMRQIFSNLNNVACFIAWAGGFAMGTWCGMMIEERLALGMQIIRIISDKDCSELVHEFKKQHHGITIVNGHGANGPVTLIFTVVKRVNKKQVIGLIHKFQPNAFYSIEDVRNSNAGTFTEQESPSISRRIFPDKLK
ncbi:MAG: DUF2179 domain-containing protein [Bacteroidia bacterium]